MRAIVREAMAAGAAGFSSSPFADGSRFARPARPEPASTSKRARGARARGRSREAAARSPTCPTARSAASTSDDGELLIRLALASRLPVIIQGLGARSKVDAPTATWPTIERPISSGRAVAGRRRLLPADRASVPSPLRLAAGTTHLRGCPRLPPALPRGADRPRAHRDAARTPSLSRRDPQIRRASEPGSERSARRRRPPHFEHALGPPRAATPANRRFEGRRPPGDRDESAASSRWMRWSTSRSPRTSTTEFLWSTDSPEPGARDPDGVSSSADADRDLRRRRASRPRRRRGVQLAISCATGCANGATGRSRRRSAELTRHARRAPRLRRSGTAAARPTRRISSSSTPTTIGPDGKRSREDRIPGQTALGEPAGGRARDDRERRSDRAGRRDRRRSRATRSRAASGRAS